jgi:hypothetical protein
MQALFSPWHHFFLEGCHTRYGNPAGCNLGAAHCITIKYNAWVVAIVLQLNTWQSDIICITIEYESDWLQLYYNRIQGRVIAIVLQAQSECGRNGLGMILVRWHGNCFGVLGGGNPAGWLAGTTRMARLAGRNDKAGRLAGWQAGKANRNDKAGWQERQSWLAGTTRLAG